MILKEATIEFAIEKKKDALDPMRVLHVIIWSYSDIFQLNQQKQMLYWT